MLKVKTSVKGQGRYGGNEKSGDGDQCKKIKKARELKKKKLHKKF